MPSARGRARDAEEATPAGRRKLLLYGGIGAAAVLFLAVVMFMPRGERPPTPEQRAETVAREAQAREEARLAERLTSAQERLKRYAAEEAANPRAYSYLTALYADLYGYCSGLGDEIRGKVKDKLESIQNTHRSEGLRTITFLQEQVDTLARDDERGYREAVALFERVPPEIVGFAEYESRYLELKETTEKYAHEERLLVELENEAKEFVRRGLYGVAEKVVKEGFSPDDFEPGSPIFNRGERMVNEFEVALVRRQEDARKAAEERLEQEKAAKREQEIAERRTTFITSKGATDEIPLLGPYDLINWPIRSQDKPWDLGKDGDGQAVLTARVPSGEGDWLLGQYGSHWEDYSLRFRVKVASGRLVLLPRVSLNPAALRFGQIGRVDLSDIKRPIVFDADAVGTDWIEVAVDAFGGGDGTQVNVTITGGSGAGPSEYSGEDLKFQSSGKEYPDRGAFIFIVTQGSTVQFMDVGLRLVRHARRGILD